MELCRGCGSAPWASVPFLRNLFGQVVKGSAVTLASALRTISVGLDVQPISQQLDVITTILRGPFPKDEGMLPAGTENDVTAFADFPQPY